MKPSKLTGLLGLTTGFSGLAITLCVNIVAIAVFRKSAAGFFSTGWWSQWFPSYTVWLVFLIIGIGNEFGRKRIKTDTGA
jgi:hypothetical protein